MPKAHITGLWRVVGLMWILFWTGCVSGDGLLEDIDPEAAPAAPTYSEHVAPLMDFYCTACHAPDVLPGEQEGYGYDTCEKVRDNWEGLVDTAFIAKNMPPGGAVRVSSADRLTLERWHARGAPCD